MGPLPAGALWWVVSPRDQPWGHYCLHYFINDIANIVHTDDSKAYTVIKSLKDSFQLQADLDNYTELVPNLVVEIKST